MMKKSKRLTSAQAAALAQLPIGESKSAYDLRAKISTLEALERMGYLKSHGGLGSIFSPRTAIEWERIK